MPACRAVGRSRKVIEPGYDSLPTCEVQSEIPVEEFDQAVLHDCDAEVVKIRMPDDWGCPLQQLDGNHRDTPRFPGTVFLILWSSVIRQYYSVRCDLFSRFWFRVV